MKIGVTCYPTYGGSGAVATELGIALAERGHEIHFISYDQPFRLGGFRERVFFHEVEMEDYPLFEHPPYALALAVALHDAARNHDLDLVHMHYAIPHAASAYLARQMLQDDGDLKIVTTLHGTDITLVGLHPSFHEITRFSILQSDGLTAVSRYLRDETVRDFAVPGDRIEVIPNFIDVEAWRPGLEPCHRATLAPGGEKIVMHVSNFRPVKRVHDVVDVFSRIVGEIDAANGSSRRKNHQPSVPSRIPTNRTRVFNASLPHWPTRDRSSRGAQSMSPTRSRGVRHDDR